MTKANFIFYPNPRKNLLAHGTSCWLVPALVSAISSLLRSRPNAPLTFDGAELEVSGLGEHQGLQHAGVERRVDGDAQVDVTQLSIAVLRAHRHHQRHADVGVLRQTDLELHVLKQQQQYNTIQHNTT